MTAQSLTPSLNKSILTNGLSLLLIGGSLFIQHPKLQLVLANVGFFALSGALTNWIAVHMLFEKVPGLYGSGVIENRFEELKFAIKNLIQEQFFNERHLKSMVEQETQAYTKHLDKLAEIIDYDALYLALVDAILSSSMGGMLQMVGGAQALEPIKPKFKEKMDFFIRAQLQDPSFINKLNQALDNQEMVEILQLKLEAIIDARLNEMTPQMVKIMMKDIMHKHLGWLVVWGGAFGGLIGLVKSFVIV